MTIKNNVVFNLDKAVSAVRILNNYFKSNESIAIVPYPDIVEYGSQEYFVYIFYSCLLDYGMKSNLYHKNLINTYLEYPIIFNPEYILSHEHLLDDILRNSVHVRYRSVSKTKWLKLSEFLSHESNLKEKLYSFNTYEELCNYIDSTKSYGQKTGGLLKRLITDLIGKYQVLDIPIDRHDIEISYLIDVVSEYDLSSSQIKCVSDLWVEASFKEHVNPSLVDQYLWSVGVNFCTKKDCKNCPLNIICKYKK